MRRYLKFAASFWVSAFQMTGSMVVAQTKSTAKAKKDSGRSTTSSGTQTAGTTTAVTTAHL